MSKRFFILLLMLIYITIAIPNYALILDRDQNDSTKNLKPDIYKKAIRLVAIVVMQDENNKDLSFGSGFFVNDNSIATNLHVVRGVGVKKGYIKVQDKKFNIVGVKIDEDNDLALISVDKVKARSLTIADSGKAKIGDDVYTIGSPFDLALEGTFSQGIISGIRDKGIDDHKGPLLQITAPVSSGCSGGPC